MLETISNSIRNRLVMVVLVTTFTALTFAGLALVLYELRAYQHSWVGSVATQAEILGMASAPAIAFNDKKTAQENLLLLSARPEFSAAAIYNANGKLFASYKRSGAAEINLPGLPGGDGTTISGAEVRHFKRIVANNEILGTVFLSADYEWTSRLMDYLKILGGVMGLSLLVALLVSTWLQRTVSKPILDMSAIARQVIERRDFALRVSKTTTDEIGYLADAINDMLAEVGRRSEALEKTNRTLAHEMKERERAEDDLKKLNLDLERRVGARTAELEAANKELEGFSYSVSHDLRAPLRAVVGYSRMLSEDYGEHLDKEAQRLLGVVQDEAQRMGVLIDDLLAFSRLGRQAVHMAEVDMLQLARATYESLINQHQGPHVELRLAVLPSARGDRALLGQVWVNLLANALKFSSKREKPLIEVSAITDSTEHIYFVRDNGAGFDSTYQAKLFGVFQRLHSPSEFPGTGVGLALAQRIVARHGGRIWAEGQLDRGATFYFTLPKEQPDEPV